MKTRTKRILNRLGTLRDIKNARAIMVKYEGDEQAYRVSKDDAVEILIDPDISPRFTAEYDNGKRRLTLYFEEN